MRIQQNKKGFPKETQLKSLAFFLPGYVKKKNSANNFNLAVEIVSEIGEPGEVFNKKRKNITCENLCEC